MIYTLVVALIVLWLIGVLAHIGGAIVHVLLVIAVIVLLYRFITGKRVA